MGAGIHAGPLFLTYTSFHCLRFSLCFARCISGKGICVTDCSIGLGLLFLELPHYHLITTTFPSSELSCIMILSVGLSAGFLFRFSCLLSLNFFFCLPVLIFHRLTTGLALTFVVEAVSMISLVISISSA